MRKEKWFFLCILYKPPSISSQYFLESLSDIIDYYSNIYDNHIVIGDFNLEPSQECLKTFMETHNYFNLIKTNTCFKGPGLCIDLILTNRKYCLIETGISDHHHLIYSILKSTFEKEEPKQILYRGYKKFQWQQFENDLRSSLDGCNGNFDKYEKSFTTALNLHAQKKIKILRGNHKPHYNKYLRKAIMKRSRLKNKANKSKQPIDIASYKKKRNLVVSLNRKSNWDYFNSISSSNDKKLFWKQCKPYFSNKHAVGDSKIILIENNKMILDSKSVSDEFNNYFSQIVDSLELHEFPSEIYGDGTDDIANIIAKFRTHPSIVKIKNHFQLQGDFSFVPITKDEIVNIINGLLNNKTAIC